MTSKLGTRILACGLLVAAPLGAVQAADTGPYLGGSIGTAVIEVDVGGFGPTPPVFDENDFGWKVLAGYNFGVLPLVDLGVEGGYVNFGNPSTELIGVPVSLEADGWNVFGVVGVDLGPLGVFGKVGYLSWDVQGVVDTLSAEDDGSDFAYGIGARFNLSNLEIRGEYELYDIDDTEDVSMWSVGIVWHFD